MRVSHRVPLTGTQVVATRIAELRGTLYSWYPDKRKFVLKHFGVPIEIENISSRVIAMLIISKGDVEMPDVVPLTPPKEPYRRAAWDHGFTAPKRKETVEQARREILAAKAKGGGAPPLVIDRGLFIFIFAHEQRQNGPVYAPFAWATEHGATAVAIREALKDIRR